MINSRHNASALSIVHSCVKQLPKTKNIAYFDSAFHHTIPKYIRTYPIDPVVAKKNKLRKYGFHGISYAFITRSVAEYLKKSEDDVNLIALHLGSGASACAIRHGKSLNNSYVRWHHLGYRYQVSTDARCPEEWA